MHKLTCDIVICTKNRSEDLKKAIDSILAQTVLPDEVIITDASDDNRTQKLIEDYSYRHARPVFKYIKSPISSSTYQRNLGIKAAKHDITFFFDDDVVLERNYLAETIHAYNENPDIAGVSGFIINFPVYHFFLNIFRIIFLLPYYSKKGPNILQASGFPRVSTENNGIRPTQFMEGGSCSYRRKILDQFKFDESLSRYALFEDIDLSYRVSRKKQLLRVAASRLNHFSSPINRINSQKYREKLIFNHFYLFKKNFPKSLKHILAHIWSHLGLIIECIGAAIIKRDVGYIKGCLNGYKNIYRYIRHHKLPDT